MSEDRYGPNSAAVEKLIAHARRLTADEVMRLGVLQPEWDLVNAAMDAGWDVALTMGRLHEWHAAGYAALQAAEISVASHTGRNAGMRPSKGVHAAWDAACALVVRDLIDDDTFNVLHGPWASVIEGADGE